MGELTAETRMLGHQRTLPRVPRHLEAQWARAMADGFDAVVEANRLVKAAATEAADDLDRALKWQLVLPQLLLRAYEWARRSTRTLKAHGYLDMATTPLHQRFGVCKAHMSLHHHYWWPLSALKTTNRC